jgi:ABC-type microcin C transport system permease subunit YejE
MALCAISGPEFPVDKPMMVKYSVRVMFPLLSRFAKSNISEELELKASTASGTERLAELE